MAIKKIGILVGGGPAPGTNGVIAAVAIEAIKLGCTPIGFHDGLNGSPSGTRMNSTS